MSLAGLQTQATQVWISLFNLPRFPLQTTMIDGFTTTNLVPLQQAKASSSSGAVDSSEFELDSETTDMHPAITVPAVASLADIAETFQQAALDKISGDDDANDSNNSAAGIGLSFRLPITDVFDFSTDYWTDLMVRKANRGLADELQFYELLNLDADGEIDENDSGCIFGV